MNFLEFNEIGWDRWHSRDAGMWEHYHKMLTTNFAGGLTSVHCKIILSSVLEMFIIKPWKTIKNADSSYSHSVTIYAGCKAS